jgi:hypothetical protein
MRHLAQGCVILCLASLAACWGQRVRPAAKIVNCGEIETDDAPMEITKASKTDLGYVNVMPALESPKFKPGCPNIEAKLGTRFGIQVVVTAARLWVVPLVTRVTHPEIRNPASGRSASVDQWESPMNSGIPRYAGWRFDKPWELVPGRWRIEILDGESRVIAAQDFTGGADESKLGHVS